MITSTANDTIKHIMTLVKNAKARRKEGLFVIEGERMAREIPEDRLKDCFVSEDFLLKNRLDEVFGYDVRPVEVSANVFKKMSDTMSPQGILCVCTQQAHTVQEIIASEPDSKLRLLILEGIQDPGNLGTMIRSAEGAGFDAVIADDNTVDVYNPKVTRSTMGSLFRVPVIYTQDLLHTIDLIKEASVTVYAAHLKGNVSYRDERYPKRTAFLIGNEGAGLSDSTTGKADKLIKIPMQGKLESLNAAVAASLLMFGVND